MNDKAYTHDAVVSSEYVCTRLSVEIKNPVFYNPGKKSFITISGEAQIKTLVQCLHNPLEIRINEFISPENVKLIAQFYVDNLNE